MIREANSEDRNIIIRLNAIMLLSIENMIAGGLISKARAIEILYLSGMTPTEIGMIFGQPAANIGSLLSKLKKQKRGPEDKTRKKSKAE